MKCSCGCEDWVVKNVVGIIPAAKGFTHTNNRTEYICYKCGLALGEKPAPKVVAAAVKK